MVRVFSTLRAAQAVSFTASVVAVNVALLSLAHAQDCKIYDASGRWAAIQNNNLNPVFDLQQSGAKFSGTALLNTFGASGTGQQRGTITGEWGANGTFLAHVTWPGTTGVYDGKVRPSGAITGLTWSYKDPSVRVAWRSQRAMKCMTAAVAPAPPQPIQVPSSGGDKLQLSNRAGPSAIAAATATCKIGFVWRVARSDDLVCVTPQSRARVAEENRTAASRARPGQSACLSGFVWREAFNGDGVCVTPQVRAMVLEENRLAPSRRGP